MAFRTLCLEQIPGLEKVSLPGVNPGELQEVNLYTDVSPVVEGVFKTSEAAFYSAAPGADGKPVLKPVGKATLGKSERQLFIFAPVKAADGKPAYGITVFDDDTKTFPMGHIRAINLAPVPIRFQLSGELTPQIAPTKFAQFPHSKKVNDYNMYPVLVQFLSGNGEWVNGQSVSWRALENRREIVITSVDLRTKQPTVNMFADFPPWMEKPASASGN
ncbi:hypothetical protein [Luteolibacter yonseiensis]|uniref:hypothetical protein n=1 Tax=Luteolibacter yonseiensis TaxID=1144680 RepID=UPI0031ED1674